MTIWNGLTSDGAVVPIQVDDQGRVVAVGSGPDSPLVVDGNYLRPRDPDLGLGTANIDLDASGGASFAEGKLVVESSTGQFTFEPQSTAGKISTAYSAGVANSTSIVGLDKDDAETWRIKADGSATFKGSIAVGGTEPQNQMAVYEQKLWTPMFSTASLAEGTNAISSYSLQSGHYTRVGNMVTCNFILETSSDWVPTGGAASNQQLTIDGLPYPLANVIGGYASGYVGYFTKFVGGYAGGTPTLYANPDERRIYIYFAQTDGSAPLTLASIAGPNSTIIGSMTYFA